MQIQAVYKCRRCKKLFSQWKEHSRLQEDGTLDFEDPLTLPIPHKCENSRVATNGGWTSLGIADLISIEVFLAKPEKT